MVRRGGDEGEAGQGVADFGHEGVDLVAGELAALAGLGALGHLNLQVAGVAEVVGRDAEAPGGDLLDGAAEVGAEALGILAAFARVAHRAEGVHRLGNGLVRLGAERTEAHRAGDEVADDGLLALHLVERDGGGGGEAEEAAQGAEVVGLVVDGVRVALEALVVSLADGLTEVGDGLRGPEVALAAHAIGVLAAGGQGRGLDGRERERGGERGGGGGGAAVGVGRQLV